MWAVPGRRARVSRLDQHPHPVTDHCGQLLDSIEEFRLFRRRRFTQVIGGIGEIVTH